MQDIYRWASVNDEILGSESEAFHTVDVISETATTVRGVAEAFGCSVWAFHFGGFGASRVEAFAGRCLSEGLRCCFTGTWVSMLPRLI